MFFRILALGDVAGDAVESHRSTVRVARDRRGVFQPAHLAIGTDDAVLDGHAAFFVQVGKHLGNPGPILWVNNVHEELRVCIEGAGRSAIDPSGGRVKVQRLVGVRGNGPYDVVDGRQDVGEASKSSSASSISRQSFFGYFARFQSCPACSAHIRIPIHTPVTTGRHATGRVGWTAGPVYQEIYLRPYRGLSPLVWKFLIFRTGRRLSVRRLTRELSGRIRPARSGRFTATCPALF